MRKRKYNKLKCFKIGAILIMVCVSLWAKMDTKEERVRFTQINMSEPIQREIYLEVPQICQYPTLPTGCESVAATMVLQYYGDDIEAEAFASSWLTCNSNFYVENGTTYGPDPNKVFVGNPFSKNSYGCFAPVIEKAINDNSSVCQAEMIQGETLKSLCDTYVSRGEPLLVWVTMSMKEPYPGNRWTLSDGTEYTWLAGEHCMVLVGYDERHYYLNDPMSGGTVGYDKVIVEKRYEEMGMQTVYISLKK